MRLRVLVVVACVLVGSSGRAEPGPESLRITPLVRVIQEVEPAVLSLFVPINEGRGFASGSGTIIHPAGYVLTNNHVLPQPEGFAIYRGKPIRFATVGRLPEKDIALVRLLGAPGPFPFLRLGHSHDILNGESVVVSGNPGGRGVVFTSGIISAKRVLIDAPNALVMTQFNNDNRDAFIQFDAASNRGNSGGPLVNMDRQVIGIVSAMVPQEQNVGFAIPVDRVRELLERTLDPEVVHEKRLGVRLNPLADPPLVTEVAADSPAAQAGLQPGDILISVDGESLQCAADWTIHLHRQLPTVASLSLIVKRGTDTVPIKLTPAARAPDASEEPSKENPVEPGLAFALHHLKTTRLPDFKGLQPVRTGTTTDLKLEPIRGDREVDFAVVLTGFVKVPQEGLYRLIITSDDGSRLYWHGQLFLDNDGNHPAMPASRLVRAKAGLHPIRIEYFQGTGNQSLELKLERLDGQKIEDAGALEYFH